MDECGRHPVKWHHLDIERKTFHVFSHLWKLKGKGPEIGGLTLNLEKRIWGERDGRMKMQDVVSHRIHFFAQLLWLNNQNLEKKHM